MLEKHYFTKPDHTDLHIYRCGTEDCRPGHAWGPGVRDHYIVHIVLTGSGVFDYRGQQYALSAGDGFIVPPDEVVYYQASHSNPWTYAWVGFHGIKSSHYLQRAGISSEKPMFRYDQDQRLSDALADMISCAGQKPSGDVMMLSHLYRFLGLLIDNCPLTPWQTAGSNRREQYLQQAVEYIHHNYSRKLSIAEISQHVGLDRSYMFTLFRDDLGVSPTGFLMSFRMEKACELLGNNALSIADVSRSVGYDDQLLFSRMFKKITGMSPSQYRNSRHTFLPR